METFFSYLIFLAKTSHLDKTKNIPYSRMLPIKNDGYGESAYTSVSPAAIHGIAKQVAPCIPLVLLKKRFSTRAMVDQMGW